MTEDSQDDWIFALEATELDEGTGPSGTVSLARCQTCHPEASEAGLHALEYDGGGGEAPPWDTSSNDDEWLMMDSGAAVSACPLDYAPEVALAARGTACPPFAR